VIIGILQKVGKPLIGVCSYGRSGSSFLMKFLESAGLAVVGDLPFEDRTSQAVLISNVRFRFSLDTQSPGVEVPNHQAFNGEFYRSSIPTHAGNIQELDATYEVFLRNTVGDRVALAEKFVGTILLQMFRAFDDRGVFKPVFLVRDPRDIFISVKQFNKKRGINGFSEADDDVALFERICGFALWQIRQAGKFGAHVCYYEDLILQRSHSILALLRYVGVREISREKLDEIWEQVGSIKGADAHVTSESASKSISRWQSNEFLEYYDIFNQFKKQLLEIGYL
jgi:hypothetical protein